MHDVAVDERCSLDTAISPESAPDGTASVSERGVMVPLPQTETARESGTNVSLGVLLLIKRLPARPHPF